MKKIIVILLAATICISLLSCTKNNNETPNGSDKLTPVATDSQSGEAKNSPMPQASATPVNINEQPEAYISLIELYNTALGEKWGGEQLIQNDMSLVMLDCYGDDAKKNIGYTIKDFDEDGNLDLVIATMPTVTDEYYSKLVFALYTIDNDGSAKQLFVTSSRDRYYYAGDNLFANISSDSADKTYSTTLKLEYKDLVDITQATDQKDYVQLDLTAFGN